MVTVCCLIPKRLEHSLNRALSKPVEILAAPKHEEIELQETNCPVFSFLNGLSLRTYSIGSQILKETKASVSSYAPCEFCIFSVSVSLNVQRTVTPRLGPQGVFASFW